MSQLQSIQTNFLRRTCSAFIVLLVIACTGIPAFSQSTWYKYPGNPVFRGGEKGDWDEHLFDYDILIEEDGYHMWYQGWSSAEGGLTKFGYATSADGLHWDKYPENPLEFDYSAIGYLVKLGTFDIIRKDSAYLMWFTAETSDPAIPCCIGHARSANGLAWTIHPEPALFTDWPAEWDAGMVSNPNIVFDGNIFHMWYTGMPDNIPKKTSLGYATSKDGIHWNKYPGNPVLTPGEPGSWDDHWVVGYSITTSGSRKEIWYFGFDQIKFEIGMATSRDGIHWTKSPHNPILESGKPGEWDAWLIGPRVFASDPTQRMWYAGIDGYGYATTSLAEVKRWENEDIEPSQRIIRIQVFNRLEYINVDSLEQILPGLTGTRRIDACNRLALAYSMNDGPLSLSYAEKALALSIDAEYIPGSAMAHYSIGNMQYVQNKYPDALANQLTALRIFEAQGMLYEAGNLFSQIASIHTYAEAHELACRYHRQGLEVFEQLKDTLSIMNALNFLGKALLDSGDTLGARRTFEKQVGLARVTGNSSSLGTGFEGLGRTFGGPLLDSGIYYITEAQKIWESQGSSKLTSNGLLLTETYLASGPSGMGKAEEGLRESYDRLKRGIGDSDNQLQWFYLMADLEMASGRYVVAKEHLESALGLCGTFLAKKDKRVYTTLDEKLDFGIRLKQYMEKIFMLYYRLDLLLNDKDAALQHFRMATAWRDSVSNEQAWKKVAMIQGNYDMEISKGKIAVLEKENEIQHLNLKRSRVYVAGLGGLALLIILGAILFIRQRRIRTQHALEVERLRSKRFEELDRLKTHLFTNISHELRTPLTLIMGPLGKALSRSDDELVKKDLGVARNYTGKLLALINNLLAISKLESGKMQLHTSETDLVQMVRICLQTFESAAAQKAITLEFSPAGEEIKVFIDREKFEQVMNNLLSNALKFTGEGGRIGVAVDQRQLAGRDWAEIKVSDTGIGIPPEHVDRIFDRFYRGDQENEGNTIGTGIGLALSKELVELHQGSIKVESDADGKGEGKGSVFTVLLPLGKDHLKPEQIVENRDLADGSWHPKTDLITVNAEPDPENVVSDPAEDIPLMLIVEDNADMRAHIRGYFQDEAHIIEAAEGAEAYQKAIDRVPDIIISDVMMPGMDGNELCRKLKTDERTSHIPVVLLTARASKEHRIEGLETGADDFITKPFDGDELQVRVKNLLHQRRRLRKLLEGKIRSSLPETFFDLSDSGITSMDAQFLRKVMEVVDRQHADPEFNTTALGLTIGLGRVQLNRKIKALTGQTTTSFIRTFRLNSAAGLIKKKSATIAEIAYDVGFSSPSYFAECFRSHFGVLPSEFNQNR